MTSSEHQAGVVSPSRDRPAAEPPLIRLRHLSHFFGQGDNRKQILFDINLQVRAGEILIMSGPSGSGKTTLLTLMGAVRSVQQGSVQVLGTDLKGLDRIQLAEVRRQIGFVFQHHGLFESLTALQNVKLALELHGDSDEEARHKAADILTRLGLGHRLYYKPHRLSGGQKQRVAVARALVAQPRLVLADEPTAALDKGAGREVVNFFGDLALRNGSAVLIVTHDNRILDVADRILNMVDGRIISDILVEESVVICQFLSRCPVFSELTPQALSEVADKMATESFPASTVLIRQGDPGDKFYLIGEGSVEVRVDDGTSGRVVAVLGQGEFFGEAALITGEPRNATVVAREPVQIYTLMKQDFQRALDTSASFREQLLAIFFQRRH